METLSELLKRAEIKRNSQKEAKKKDAWFEYEPTKFYVKMHLDIASQSYGTRIQNYLCHHAGANPVTAKEDRGDALSDFGVYHEIKASYKTANDTSYNFLQIRLWQKADYLFVAIDPDDGYSAKYYKLTHRQAVAEDLLIGNNCHGTVEANAKNLNVSRKLSFKENSEAHHRWNTNYLLPSYEEALNVLKNYKKKVIVKYDGLGHSRSKVSAL